MGHTIDKWRAKVGELLRDEAGVDLSPTDLDDIGLFPAFAEHSRWRPHQKAVEVAGTGVSYLSTPAGWVSDFSEWDLKIEYPARQNPPRWLDSHRWRVGRSAADVEVEQILLDATPANGEYVRLWFPGVWPFPGDDATVDKLDDLAFEAVSSLAAAYCCENLGSLAARGRDGAIPSDLVAGEDRSQMMGAAAERLRAQYRRLAGTTFSVA